MASLNDLSKQMNDLANQLPVLAAVAKAKTGKVILDYVVRNTPVDTSMALSNWTPTWGTPSSRVRSPFYAGKTGSTYAESVEETLIAGGNVLSIPEVETNLYITNNVDYIEALETQTGLSKQAGYFVEGALIAGQEFLDRYIPVLPVSL